MVSYRYFTTTETVILLYVMRENGEFLVYDTYRQTRVLLSLRKHIGNTILQEFCEGFHIKYV